MTVAVEELEGAALDDWDARAVDAPRRARAAVARVGRAPGGGWLAPAVPRGRRGAGPRARAPVAGRGRRLGLPAARPGRGRRALDASTDPAPRSVAALAAVAAHLEATGVDVVAADPEVAAGDAAYAGALAVVRVPRDRRDPALAPPDGPGPAGRRRRRGRDGRRRQGDPPADPACRARRRRRAPLGRAPRRGHAWTRHIGRPNLRWRPSAASTTSCAPRATGAGSGSPGADEFVTWWVRALAAGHLVYLEAREASVDGDVLGGLVLYRHGRRLSTAHSADRAERRHDHPGAMHLLRWRAIELALAERRTEMDLGGADVAGARRPPEPGEPTYGLYEHKRSFGARWVALAGAQERVARALALRGRVARRRGPAARSGGGRARDRRRAGPGPRARSPSPASWRRRSRPTPRAVAGLVERLRAADLVRGARRDHLPIGAAGLGDIEVRGVTDDSRAVREGTLFVAVRGFHVDGHDFVASAAASGAAAAIVEHPVPDAALPQLVVSAARPALARAACWWYGDPSRALGVVGDHRHRRQDDDLVPGRGRARGGGPLDGPRRHGRDADRRRCATATPPT